MLTTLACLLALIQPSGSTAHYHSAIGETLTVSDSLTVVNCYFHGISVTMGGAAISLVVSDDRTVEIRDTSFHDCHSERASDSDWPRGIIRIDGKSPGTITLTIIQCCAVDCSAVSGQFLFTARTNTAVGSTNCHLCARPSATHESGPFHLDSFSIASVEYCNLTTCCVNSHDYSNGAAFKLVGKRIDGSEDQLSYLTIVDCRGPSICDQQANSNETPLRVVKYDCCNFVGNHGSLYRSTRGHTQVVNCNFKENVAFENSAEMNSAKMVAKVTSPAWIVILGCRFGFEPPTAGGRVSSVSGNTNQVLETWEISHFMSGSCPNGVPFATQSSTPTSSPTISSTPTSSPVCDRFLNQVYFSRKTPEITQECLTIEDCVFAYCTSGGEWGGGVGIKNREKAVLVYATTFMHCLRGQSSWHFGGAIAVQVADFLMERCCGLDCASNSGQFLFVQYTPKSTVRWTNCYLCADPTLEMEQHGALEWDSQCPALVETCNITSCGLGSRDVCQGAAVSLYGGSASTAWDELRFLTIVDCSGNSICANAYASQPTGPRYALYRCCNFVGNHGSLIYAFAGETVVNECYFVENQQFGNANPLPVEQIFQFNSQMEGKAKISLSWFDNGVPVGDNTLTVESCKIFEGGVAVTLDIQHHDPGECPDIRTRTQSPSATESSGFIASDKIVATIEKKSATFERTEFESGSDSQAVTREVTDSSLFGATFQDRSSNLADSQLSNSILLDWTMNLFKTKSSFEDTVPFSLSIDFTHSNSPLSGNPILPSLIFDSESISGSAVLIPSLRVFTISEALNLKNTLPMFHSEQQPQSLSFKSDELSPTLALSFSDSLIATAPFSAQLPVAVNISSSSGETEAQGKSSWTSTSTAILTSVLALVLSLVIGVTVFIILRRRKEENVTSEAEVQGESSTFTDFSIEEDLDHMVYCNPSDEDDAAGFQENTDEAANP
jgi:hypothetical protein